MTADQLIIYAISFVFAFIIAFFLVRWMWKIDSSYKLNRATFDIMCKIAEKQGVTKGEVEVITNTYNL